MPPEVWTGRWEAPLDSDPRCSDNKQELDSDCVQRGGVNRATACTPIQTTSRAIAGARSLP